ncbi:Stk1 family PASTA domain-containing Ser/Thr kinase [Lacticigenium naphthae]|uniref:Stk1 family PASTA domain-containing Ser/Thr kinase n=1 Tax=Lacticigenium naphthae TaxID=515351 RepID=UPI0003FC3E4F|nr:Stk1 family PASTA domain-containing Ser/Thr kinase [Lacticigenium naphthae]
MEIGERINKRYKIIKNIGSGGMANVFLAKDLILERDVAVKVMRYDFRNDETSIRRFKREALSTTELYHPNIVSIYDVGEEENPYIVMEYVEGMDLKKYIHENHPISYKNVLAIMDQVLSAVNYAHEQGIIHRDLKPQNILMDHEGNVKITDFGIAIALSQNSITQTNSLLGSVHYISPEQARGSMATKQSDIYSLGIILYEMLIGEVPFNGESAVSVALKHFQEELPSLRNVDTRIPQPLENVVLKATAKEKEHRYKSAEEMRVDLATSLFPERSHEEKFVPVIDDNGETKVLNPIVPPKKVDQVSDTPIESSTKAEGNIQKKDTKKKKWPWLFLLLLPLIVGIIYIVSLPNDVSIPDVAGMTETEAEEALTEQSLVIKETLFEASDEFDEDTVTRTNPRIGSIVKENSEVTLYISTGKETMPVADYSNENYERTRAELTELGFTVESTKAFHESIEEGNIISQSIDEGAEVVPLETTIEFVVSSGRPRFELIDLSGYSENSVMDYAEDNNINVAVTYRSSEDIPEGQVITQSPEAGETLYANSRISVEISLGPEEIEVQTVTRTVNITYVDPESEEADATNQVIIYLEDNERSLDEIHQQFEITEDREITLTFLLSPDSVGAYRIERDGEIIEENNTIRVDGQESEDTD